MFAGLLISVFVFFLIFYYSQFKDILSVLFETCLQVLPSLKACLYVFIYSTYNWPLFVFIDAGYIQENGVLNLERYEKYIAALVEVVFKFLSISSDLPYLYFIPVCAIHTSPIWSWRTSLMKKLERKGKNNTGRTLLIWMSGIKIFSPKWWNPMLLEYSGCCSTITLECHHGTGGCMVL